MIGITLDNNCLIDLEQTQGAAASLTALVNLWRLQKIQLCVTAITAAEVTRTGQMAPRLDDFDMRLSKAGLQGVRVLPSIFYRGIGYYGGTSIYGTPDMFQFEKSIHNVLFPNIEYEYQEYCLRKGIPTTRGYIDPKWRNAKIDVLCLWSHIHARAEKFVTRDKNFHKASKKSALIQLGANDILYPDDVLSLAK